MGGQRPHVHTQDVPRSVLARLCDAFGEHVQLRAQRVVADLLGRLMSITLSMTHVVMIWSCLMKGAISRWQCRLSEESHARQSQCVARALCDGSGGTVRWCAVFYMQYNAHIYT